MPSRIGISTGQPSDSGITVEMVTHSIQRRTAAQRAVDPRTRDHALDRGNGGVGGDHWSGSDRLGAFLPCDWQPQAGTWAHWQLMTWACRAKFSPNAEARQALLGIGISIGVGRVAVEHTARSPTPQGPAGAQRPAHRPPSRLGSRPDGVSRGRPVAAGTGRTLRWV